MSSYGGKTSMGAWNSLYLVKKVKKVNKVKKMKKMDERESWAEERERE